MNAAEIRRRRPEDAEVERIARVYVSESGGPAHIEVLIPEFAEGIESMLGDGVTDDNGRFLTLQDGEAFIKALPTFYRGSRFWAQSVPSDELSVPGEESD